MPTQSRSLVLYTVWWYTDNVAARERLPVGYQVAKKEEEVPVVFEQID